MQISFAHAYTDPILKLTSQAYKGNLESQVELAAAYEHGMGIKKDYEQALKWYCKAALGGSVDAQRDLAWMLLNDRGIENGEALAVHWFKVAARSGDSYSQKTLLRLDKNLRTKQRICHNIPTALWETKQCNKSCRSIVNITQQVAKQYNIESRLILSIIQQESFFNPKALSPKEAMGLMQLLPETAKRFGVKDIWEKKQNIEGGTRYLSWLLKQYEGNLSLVLAGYNAGENAVERYNGVPPYKETRHYVKRVIKLYGKSTHPIP